MLYLWIALGVVIFAIMASAVIWHYGRLERQMKLSPDELERLRGFRLAGGTDAQFAEQIEIEDERFIDDQLRQYKIGKYAG